jgi:hypothetical protein
MKQHNTSDSEVDVFNINHNVSGSFNNYSAISPSFHKAGEPNSMPNADGTTDMLGSALMPLG